MDVEETPGKELVPQLWLSVEERVGGDFARRHTVPHSRQRVRYGAFTGPAS